jgi:hypothetical protein
MHPRDVKPTWKTKFMATSARKAFELGFGSAAGNSLFRTATISMHAAMRNPPKIKGLRRPMRSIISRRRVVHRIPVVPLMPTIKRASDVVIFRLW